MIARFVLTFTDAIIGLIEFLLGVRLVLKLFGASTAAPFVGWVYETTAPLLSPFAAMFPDTRVNGRFVLELSTLCALLVYAFVAYIIETVLERTSVLHVHHK